MSRQAHRAGYAAVAGVVLVLTGVAGWVAMHNTGPRSRGTRDTPSRPATSTPASPSASHSVQPSSAPWLIPVPANTVGHLRRGSEPTVLPGMVLIADKDNNRLVVVDPYGRIRWQFPRPGDLAPRQTFKTPDDAFFTPDGRRIIATQEDDAVISVIDIATHRIVYRYGTPGRPGSGPNQLNNPDDATVLRDGSILLADIQNCRLLRISPGAHRPAHVYGQTTNWCVHDPPTRWGSPNGGFPMRNGHILVTEINGDWADELGLDGHVYWSAHPPGVDYPSDTNEISPGRYLTVDYATRGQVVIFNRAGRAVWRYFGPGRDALNHPSLALPLPNGDVILNDDFNHRVVVINPATRKVVWQYGVTGKRGNTPGLLNNPDGIDLVPPYSLLVRR